MRLCTITTWTAALLLVSVSPLASGQMLFEETFAYLDREEREAIYADSEIIRSRLAIFADSQLELGEPLALNLFPDVELRGSVADRRDLAEGGSFVYAELEDGGHASFYRSPEGIVRGIISSADGSFSVSSRVGQEARSETAEREVIIKELAMTDVRLHENDAISAPLEPLDWQAVPIETTGSANEDSPHEPDELTILVVYTPEVEVIQGGQAILQATLNLEVERLNQALVNSGIGHRRVKAKFEMVDYEESGDTDIDLDLLAEREGHEDDPDGVLDEVHSLREQHGADLVHLLVGGDYRFCGRAYSPGLSQTRWAERVCADDSEKDACVELLTRQRWRELGFGVTVARNSCLAGDSFQHELGHNFGLYHDRYTEEDSLSLEDPVRFPYKPYGFGYVNQDFTRPVCRRTIMSYRNECEDEGFTATRNRVSELRFSNPEVKFDNGLDPSGVEGDESTISLDGPVNSAKAIDDVWDTVASLFRGCPYDDLFPDFPENLSFSSLAGSEMIRFTQSGDIPGACTGADLDFSISAAEGFVSEAGISKIGTGTLAEYNVMVGVRANDTCDARSYSLVVRNESTQAVVGRILVSQEGLKLCGLLDEVPGDPNSILALDFSGRGIYRVVGSLFEDFTGLTRLNLSGNNITSLSANSFASSEVLDSLDDSLSKEEQIQLVEQDLANTRGPVDLEVLDLSHNAIEHVHADAFSGLANLTDLDLGHNRLTELPEGAFAQLGLLRNLNLGHNSLSSLPTGAFTPLSELRELDLSFNQISALQDGVFSALGNLDFLWLDNNMLASLSASIFQGMRGLIALSLDENRLRGLESNTFDRLTQLRYLWLGLDELGTIPSGLFKRLQQLVYLNLSVNAAANLPSDVFAGLSNLRYLHLSGDALTDLPSEVCQFIAGVRHVKATGFNVETLCDDRDGASSGRHIPAAQNTRFSLRFSHVNAVDSIAPDLIGAEWQSNGHSQRLQLKLKAQAD